jgi:FHA domain
MSTVACPNGHESTLRDFCDVCGAPIGEGAAGASAVASPAPEATAPSAVAGPRECPHCGTYNDAAAPFCEACGYDFTTGTMPWPPAAVNASPDLDAGVSPGSSAPVAPAIAVDWVAEVWVDPDWFAAQESDDACPSPGLPEIVPLRLQSLLIGRPSISRSIHPDIDLTGDPGVSRRQAQLTSDGARWWVEDLQSSNGTYVRSATGPIPTTPLPPGRRRELAEGDRVYVGAWTRLVVRRATPEEQTS